MLLFRESINTVDIMDNYALLFVCVGNSCRSQMAEGIARSMGHLADSAGTHPAGSIASNAVSSTQEPWNFNRWDGSKECEHFLG